MRYFSYGFAILQLSVLQFVVIQILIRPFLRGDSCWFLFLFGLVSWSGFVAGRGFLSARYRRPTARLPFWLLCFDKAEGELERRNRGGASSPAMAFLRSSTARSCFRFPYSSIPGVAVCCSSLSLSPVCFWLRLVPDLGEFMSPSRRALL